MTIIAAAYDSPTSYALAADSHGLVNGLRIPSAKLARLSHGWRVGHTGSAAEGHAFADALLGSGMEDPAAAVHAAYAAVLAMTHLRSRDCVGLDSHFLLVGPDGVWAVGSEGLFSRPPNRWAIGCGEHLAIGVMYRNIASPVALVRLAVEACCEIVDGCFGSPVVMAADA